MSVFGFSIKDNDKKKEKLESFSPKEQDDGAIITTPTVGGMYSSTVSTQASAQTESELIDKYRNMALNPEVELAVDDIVNEAITNDPDEPPVKIILDELEKDLPDRVRSAIEEEFNKVLSLLQFNHRSYEIFKNWYVDGRLYYYMITDSTAPQNGIKELRYIDAKNIRKVREQDKKKVGNKKGDVQVEVTATDVEYYVYNERGFTASKDLGFSMSGDTLKGLKITPDSIAYITSGLMSPDKKMVYSYLHKAIKVLNQLTNMEDSVLIYRISRAPERRIFYIDVGTLPPAKAEQHIKDMMTKFKNKMVYDSATGEVKDDRKFMSMMDDFWLSRRGEKGTEITTLPAGQNLGELTDVNYFQKKLYRSLNVPSSRLDGESNSFTLGRATQISRDELKFQKFIGRLRLRFQELFTIILGKQLILKGVMTASEWDEYSSKIAYRFSEDVYFAELKKTEIMNERMALLQQVDAFASKYYSHSWIRKNILHQTDEEIKEMDKESDEEMKDPRYVGSFQPQFDALDSITNASEQENQSNKDNNK